MINLRESKTRNDCQHIFQVGRQKQFQDGGEHWLQQQVKKGIKDEVKHWDRRFIVEV